MTTLTVMKARVASELRRSNITTQIADSITTAITAYQAERWLFNETRAVTFSTVAAQEFYTVSDSAYIPLLISLDYAKVVVGTTPFMLLPENASRMETLSDSTSNQGMPGYYVYYNQQLRLYPVPVDVYTIRLAGVFISAAPATDGEASNPWMTYGERLIRCRAKWELATHVLYDANLASTMADAVNEAFSELKRRTNKITGTSRIRSVAF